MSEFKIEIQITIVAFIIGAAVVTSGYFAYKSLSKIVWSIHQEALPDNSLFLIKDINADLSALENNVRLYILTNNKKDLRHYDKLHKQIIIKIKDLKEISGKNSGDASLTDSIRSLSFEKLTLWEGVLSLHQSAKEDQPAFKEIYSKLDELKIDTITVETEKRGLLRKIFGVERTTIDTTLVERSIEKDSLRQDIQNIEIEIAEKWRKINVLESRLIEKNMVVGEKINALISKAEKRESDNLIEKTNEADRLAALTYKRLAAFTVTSVILLFVALFVLFNFLKKSRVYERALKDAKQEAEKLARAKEQFAANVSHELRTPVNAIYGLTGQVLQKPLDTETREMVTVMSRSASHLKNIINDTLDFSKIQANKLKLETIDFAPSEVFEEVISLQKYEAAKKRIALGFTWEGEKPEALTGDPLRLKQILINLISNAIKFTEEGEVVLNVKTTRTVNQTFEMEMRVADTGIGMSKENQKIIFDEFVQAENQTGKKYSGTGLGLAIVKKLVELQGGKITLKSKPGQGTELTVNVEYPEGRKDNIPVTEWEIPSIPEALKQLEVLIADDEEFNRYMLKGILKNWGISFWEVKNGEEAVKASSRKKFDVILMDLHMPAMNGIEAAKAIIKIHPGITIVPTSATNDQVDRQACENAGMKGFLLKPFSETDLFDTLILLVPVENQTVPEPGQPKIDVGELTRIAGGDKKFLHEMILLYIKSMDKGVESISEAIQKEDWKSVFENAHKMAAPCKHMRATHLYNNIKKLEKLANKAVKPALIPPVFQEIKIEAAEINAFLKLYLEEKND
jgi:signal transduction histidine kinase/CHASE3 domain sensor protein/HPt (histidine-containing phosphotransfer) domain-containing protein/ActR/RegA family two-component response regulator